MQLSPDDAAWLARTLTTAGFNTGSRAPFGTLTRYALVATERNARHPQLNEHADLTRSPITAYGVYLLPTILNRTTPDHDKQRAERLARAAERYLTDNGWLTMEDEYAGPGRERISNKPAKGRVRSRTVPAPPPGTKPRCPQCGSVARSLRRYVGTDPVPRPVTDAAECPEHGTFLLNPE